MLEHFPRNWLALRDDYLAVGSQVRGELAPLEQLEDALVSLLVKNTDFVLQVATQPLFFSLFDCQ